MQVQRAAFSAITVNEEGEDPYAHRQGHAT